jgi:hypothetical protein
VVTAINVKSIPGDLDGDGKGGGIAAFQRDPDDLAMAVENLT